MCNSGEISRPQARKSLEKHRKLGSGQVINVFSIAAVVPFPFEGYYAAAKAALLAWSEAMRNEVKILGIRVSVVEPGFFRTNLGNAEQVAKNTIQDYNELRERATSALDDDFQRGGDPKIVAETVLRIIRSKTPRLEYAVGKEKRYRTLKRMLPQSMLERGIRRHWKLDE